MGALHEGHLTLVRRARRDLGRVVVSVFVNPTQFDRPEDLERYPRQPELDARMLEEAGADLLFLPSVGEVYPRGVGAPQTTPDLAGLDLRYEGAARPGHFTGVVQVVRALLQLVRPTAMYMGQKDAQQVAVLRQAARAECWATDIIDVPIVREPSGLAMSSRNGLLSGAGLARASKISATLRAARTAWLELGHSARDVERAGRVELQRAGLRPEYFDLVQPDTFERLPDVRADAFAGGYPPLLVAVAWCEGVRLIDNLSFGA